jgi:SAM-dependent methyltransferase
VTRRIFLAALASLPAAAQRAPLRAPDVRYDPSTPDHVRAMLELADVNKRDIVFDLGSGDGRLVIAAAKTFGARGVGIEIDPKLVAESNERARSAGVARRVEFRAQDLFEADIRKATVVMLYLWPSVNLELRPKLWKDLKPGTRVVSNSHDMGDWKPDQTIKADGHFIYLWTITKALKK